MVTTGISSSSSQFISFRATDVVEDSDVSRQVNMVTNRIDFPSISSQVVGHAERGAGAAVYSQCPMPREVPCYQEPLLMPSAPVAQNSFTAAASQASEYGARAEPACSYYNQLVPSSFYYPPGSWSQPLLSSQKSFQQAPSYPPYHSNISQLVSQIPTVVPPPAATEFPSAPIHSATSFQPHPRRFDVFAPGMSQDDRFSSVHR